MIYMIMAILYEDFIHPVTILTALPLAAFGALLMLCVFPQELNLFSFVGLILLVGLVKKNGIMLVDFALEHLRGQAQGEASTNGDADRRPDDAAQAVRAAMLEACMTASARS